MNETQRERFPVTARELLSMVGPSSVFAFVMIEKGVPKPWAAVTAVMALTLLLVIVSLARLRKLDSNRFRFYDVRTNEMLRRIDGVQQSMLVTHFSRAIPLPAYIRSMTNALKGRGVAVVRILPRTADINDPAYRWLQAFTGTQRYIQKHTESGNLPFDIFVFDKETVFFVFPSSVDDAIFQTGIYFRNKEVADWFETSLNRLRYLREEVKDLEHT